MVVCWGMEQYTIPVRLICGIKINDLTVMKLRKGHTHTYSSTINNGNLNLLFVRILCESLFLVLFQTACIWNDISMVKCYRCFWFVIGNDIVFTCVQMNEMKWNERNLLLSTSKDGMSTVSFLMRLQTNTRCVWFWNTTFVCKIQWDNFQCGEMLNEAQIGFTHSLVSFAAVAFNK